jgi:pimeloyl-ACP methyl ester carboxylesterase
MGNGPALVMIPGGLLDHRMWDDQFDEFAKQYRVIRYDVRGHGLSKGVPGAYRDDRDLAGLLKHLGLERAHIMGLSNGGRIAIDFALEYPEMTRSVVAVGPGLSGYQFSGEGFSEDMAAMGPAIRRGDLDKAVEHFQRSWTDGTRKTEQVDAGVRERVRRMARWGIEPGRSLAQVRWPDPPAAGRLREIKAPTLCVVGDRDMPDVMMIVNQIVAQVPGAKKVVFKGAAHMVNMEQPAEFNRTVLEFLEERSSQAGIR